MNKMKAQGTTPEFVSLGNEVQAGMLYPDGSCDNLRSFPNYSIQVMMR